MVTKADVKIPYCEEYKAEAIKAISKLRTGWRLQQIFTIAKRMEKAENVDCNKAKEEKNSANCDDYRDEITKLVSQIQDKGRLIRVYSFVRKAHEIENEEMDKKNA